VTDFVYYIAGECKIITSSESSAIFTTLCGSERRNLEGPRCREAGQSPARGFRWLSGLDCYIAPGDVIITIPRQ
jgi:hypothetical protein